MRSDITLAGQFDKRKNWKDPLVDAVAATFLYRERDIGASSPLDRHEWLVTRRIKGAESGQFQAHHGGFMKVTDLDVWAAACREPREETGFLISPDDLTYVTSVGPALYRSELAMVSLGELELCISNTEAEPTVGFVLPLFLANVTGREPESDTDGEVDNQRWLTMREIIAQYGEKGEREHSLFNYFQMLLPAFLMVLGRFKVAERAVAQPGTYRFVLAS